jgi:hypothetical protein
MEFLTHNHLTILAHTNTLALHNLNVVQPAENVMLHLERRRHRKLCALLDLEGLVLEGVRASRG